METETDGDRDKWRRRQGLQQANSCLIQEWLQMAGCHNEVEYFSESHLKESGLRSIYLSLLFL